MIRETREIILTEDERKIIVAKLQNWRIKDSEKKSFDRKLNRILSQMVSVSYLKKEEFLK